MNLFNTKAFKRSRGAYTTQCAFDYFTSILVTDAFLATLLLSVGVQESMIGIITSISSFAFLFQILSIVFAKSVKTVKPFVITFNTLSEVIFVLLYVLPFFNVSAKTKTVLSFAFVLVAYICKYISAGFLFKWGNSFVDPYKRGRFSAIKEVISLVCGMFFSLAVGYIFNCYQDSGKLKEGFIFITIMLIINTVMNFACLCLIKKDIDDGEEEQTIPIRKVIKVLVDNKNYRNMVIMVAVKSFATAFVVGFLGTFKTKDLFISIGTIQVINIVGNAFRAFLSGPLGRYSDKYSFVKGYKMGLCIEIASLVSLVFITGPDRWWMIILYTILYNVSLAGTNSNASNLIYSFVPQQYFVQATAIKNVICGVISLLSALIAGWVFNLIQFKGNKFFGISMYPQQLLALVAIVIMSVAVIFATKVVEKQKIIKQ